MKKFFTLFAAMLVVIAVNATTTPVSAGSGTLSTAISNAADGDVLVLSSGEYTEAAGVGVGVNLIIKAANKENKPIVKARFGIEAGARVEFQNIKFDCSTATDHVIFGNSLTDGNELVLEGCEFYDFTANSSVIHCSASDESLDSIIVNDCYIHSIKNSFIFHEGNSLKGLKVTNSTFVNVSLGDDYWASTIYPTGNAVKVLVDHCTFYNCKSIASWYGVVKVPNSTDAVVSNSIFVMPTSYDGGRAIVNVGGYVKNCLTYNYSKSEGTGIEGGPTISSCIYENPLFTDSANSDFTYPGNYVTMVLSPARGAGTDGSDLGDPRWYTDVVLPETDFASPYVCAAAKALCSGNVSLSGGNLVWANGGDASNHGVAKWRIRVEKACYVTATINNDAGNDTKGHKFQVEIYDSKSNLLVGGPVAEAADSWSNKNDVLTGVLCIPEAGDYTIKLSNFTNHSSSVLPSITLTYSADPQTLYLIPSGDWKASSPKYAIYAFADGKTAFWSDFMELVEGETDVYTTTIPEGYSKVDIVRFDPSKTSTGNWDNKWSQTSDQTLPAGDEDLFIVTSGGTGQDCGGRWAKSTPTLENGWYIVGTFSGNEEWGIGDLSASKKFAVNPENAEEFVLVKDLVSGDRFKAAYSYYDELQTGSYKPSEGDGYVVQAGQAGANKKIQFRVEYYDDWSGHFKISDNGGATAIDETVAGEKAVKVIRNGQLFIEKDGKTYNVLGTVVK